jgi:aminopeptidase N
MRALYLLLLIPFLSTPAHSKSGNTCSENRIRQGKGQFAKVTLASPLLELYDVQHVKLDLEMTNKSTQISGSGTTTAEVLASSGMSQYAFELSEYLTIDSAFFNGIRLPVSRLDTDVFAITPSATVPRGQRFTAQIFYHGKPPSGTGFFTHGLNQQKLSSGTEITWTFSDPDLAKEWWPCKQTLSDKVDSADLWFTVDSGIVVGSNGLLRAATPLTGKQTRYEWKTNYPIDYYLISAAVAPYVRHDQMLHFTGSSDSMLLQHFVYDTAALYPPYKPALDSTPLIVDHFSTLFGRYPFWKEKYGHCIAPLSGGMEHQTMTTMIDAPTATLIAHELGHQWWGDCVTYASWRDIWLSEGFAAYCEQLFTAHFKGAVAAQNYRSQVFGRVMSRPGGTVYVDDTDNVARVFDSRLTYDKGASVAHMLRLFAPDSASYFRGLQDYQRQYAYKTAVTADFQQVMETTYGRDLDTFFNQWIYGEGFPIFTLTWNQKGSDVYLQLDQTTSRPTSVACFSLPLQLKLSSAAGDTIIDLYVKQPSHFLKISWNKAITQATIDPFDQVVNRANPVIHDETLNVNASTKQGIFISPNPAIDSWQVKRIPVGAALSLFDAAGQLKWERRQAPDTLSIPAATLTPGSYILKIQAGSRTDSYQLEKL